MSAPAAMLCSPTRVYIVDDHPLVREWLANLLRQTEDLAVCGHSAGAKEALAAMKATPPDVVIVDLSLHDSSGFDLLKDMAEQLPGVRAVVLSMHEEMTYVERAFRAGAKGYVTKREATEQIIEAVREAAAGRIYASRPILGRLAERMVGRPLLGSVEELSDRELEVFGRIGRGQSTRRIADDLSVSIKTVQAYCARIKEKLGYKDGVELMRDAVRWVDRRDRS